MLNRNALTSLAAAMALAVPGAAIAAGETPTGAKAKAEVSGSVSAETAPVADGAMTTTALAALHEVDDDNDTALWNNMTADEIEDMDIVNVSGETVGEVEDVLANEAGEIVAITAEVGGFLGIGEQEVVVALAHLALRGDELSTAMTEDDLKALPVWRN